MAQSLECGVIHKPLPDGVKADYTDRFGNGYTNDDLSLWNLNIQSANHCSQIEDFTLIFENTLGQFPFTNDEMETICDVFSYLSSVIDAPSGQKAIIRLSKDPDMAAGWAAVGTPLFPNKCGLGNSFVQQQLFTGGAVAPQHGFIEFNPDITGFYTGPEAGIGGTQLDYYSVVLHEALHVLGFASQMGTTGAPAQGFYTEWDLNLRNANGNPVVNVTPGGTGECCNTYTFNAAQNPGWPNAIWNQNCGASNLHFNVAQTPPVNGEYGAQSANTFLNVLSHLDRDCGTEHYVMHYEILQGMAGIQRTLTNAETEILCQLGYPTNTPCTPACIAIAQNDGSFFIGQGQTMILNVADLLANDFPTTATFEYLPDCGNHAGLTITPDLPMTRGWRISKLFTAYFCQP